MDQSLLPRVIFLDEASHHSTSPGLQVWTDIWAAAGDTSLLLPHVHSGFELFVCSSRQDH